MSGLITNTALTMSSQEMADLVEKRHDNVKRTIESLVDQGVIASPQVEGKPSTGGRPATVYVFSGERGKRDSIIVVAQLSPEFTARLVDRWQELEAKLERRDPMEVLNDPAALRQALLGYSEKVMALESKVQEQAPKVEIHDRIADAEGSITIRETANTLRVPERKFVLWLLQNDWCYRRSGHKSLLGYADKVKAGYLVLKQTPIKDANTGEERLSEQVRVTPLGLTVLARRLSKEAQQQDMPVGMFAGTMPGSYGARRA